MSTSSTTFDALSVPRPAAPRGARLAATLFARAARWLTQPAAPRARATAPDAAAVRQLAYGLMRTDPGFAADLFAAADRHELEIEASAR